MLKHLPAFGVSFVRIETSAYVWMLNMQVGAQALAKQSGALVGAGDCSKTSEVSFHFSACLKRSDLVGLNSIAGDPAAS